MLQKFPSSLSLKKKASPAGSIILSLLQGVILFSLLFLFQVCADPLSEIKHPNSLLDNIFIQGAGVLL